ncbi:hypothetical protein SSX86_001120 [Deinandra increscens subsp. villosa]|uniref:Uncharacterized protein n=1 Tax=Deinandra increscens subsp. villosa TaxID=3103831 RepID=A0AAP0DYF2_9ASTR
MPACSIKTIQVNCCAQRHCSVINFEEVKKQILSSFQPFIGELQKVPIKLQVPHEIIKKTSVELLHSFTDSVFEFIDHESYPSQSNFGPVEEIGEAIDVIDVQGAIPIDFPEGVYIRNVILAKPRAVSDQGSPSLALYTMKQPLGLGFPTPTRDYGPAISNLAHRLVILAKPRAVSDQGSPSLAMYTMKQPLGLGFPTSNRDYGPAISNLAHRLVILAKPRAVSDQGSPSLAMYTMKQSLGLGFPTSTRDCGPAISNLAHRLVILAKPRAVSDQDSPSLAMYTMKQPLGLGFPTSTRDYGQAKGCGRPRPWGAVVLAWQVLCMQISPVCRTACWLAIFMIVDRHVPDRRLVPAWEAMSKRIATWLILPVVICLSQRLSHACLFLDSMGGGAWPFLVGGAICLVNSVNERDLSLLTSYVEVSLHGQLLRGTMAF